jgi:hypothetical protein
MNQDTPLEEVAAHLPAEAAEYLLPFPPGIQRVVLGQLRIVVAYWEGRGLTMDPITYEIVITSIIALSVQGLSAHLPE